MKLSTKGRYAVTALLDVAMHVRSGPVSLSEIAERQHVSLSYLEQLFGKMRRRGLVESIRGPGGGYVLAHDAEDISIVDVILAVDESIDNTQCGGAANCQHDEKCLTHDLWRDLNEQIQGFLGGISLHDLAEKRSTRQVAARQNESQVVSVEQLQAANQR